MIKRILSAALLLAIMNGTASAQTAPTAVTASRTLTSADCGTRIVVTAASGATITLTQPASGSGVLASGCRISMTNTGPGTLQVNQGTGETLGFYDLSAQTSGTGNVILAGQYAGGVFTQETATIATFGEGE